MALATDFTTIAGMFLGVIDRFRSSSKPAFQRKVDGSYVGISYGLLYEQVEGFALALRSLGLREKDTIGVMSDNRIEWVVADFACVGSGIVDVPIFSTLTPKQVEYIFQNAEVKAVICSNRLQLGKLLKVAAGIPTLEHIIVMQKDAIDALQGSTDRTLISFADLVDQGTTLAKSSPDVYRQMAEQRKPEDLLTLIYTSGTTGNPKGVMLTHENFASNVKGASKALPIGDTDVVLSYLPLCHSYERTGGYYTCFGCGATIAFADSIDTVSENLQEVRPTLMTSVPRLFERIKNRVERNAESQPEKKQKIFRWAIGVGVDHYRRKSRGKMVGPVRAAKYALADKLVFTKIRERTGGRIRFFVSGGGPLPVDVGEFFFGIGLTVIEGYGLTESSPIIAANPAEKPKLGTVGLPLYNVEVKIAEDGEILTRGPHVMRGYYKDEAATQEAIDDEGWLYTGDIGRFDEDGYLKITDRKKHIIVSSGGKNIAPAPIENLLTQSRLIDQVMLIGDNRPFLTALLVPEFESLKELAQSEGIKVGDIKDEDVRRQLVDNDAVALNLEMDLRQLQRDLAAFERVRRYKLLTEPFTVDNGMMTPTLKVRRKVVEERYRNEIEKMYEGVEID